MKAAICTIVIVIGLPASSVAQACIEVAEPPTKLEAFMATDGAVIVHGSSRVGAVRGEPTSLVVIVSKEITKVSTGESARGIAVEVKKLQRREADRDRVSYVDHDEIPALLAGLEYLAKVDKASTPLDQLEASYRTKGGFVVAMHNTSDGMKAAVSSGIGGTVAELEFGHFLLLRRLLESAYANSRR
jgi:hypothetical protein